MKRSKIGDIEIAYEDKVFTLGENLNQIRQNQIVILSYLGKYDSRVDFSKDVDVENKNLDLMDDYYILYNLIENCNDKLENVMYNYFNYVYSPKQTYDDINERNELLSIITKDLTEKCNNDIVENYNISDDDYLWFKENIIDLNYYFINGKKYAEKQNIPTSINGVTETEITNKFLNCGYGYLYGCVNKNLINDSTKRIKIKYIRHTSLYKQLANVSISSFANVTTIKNYVKTSSQNNFQTSESSDEIFTELSNKLGEKSSVGFAFTATALATIISAVVTAVGVFLSALIASKGNKSALEWEKEKYYATLEKATETAEDSYMQEEDFLFDSVGNLKYSNLFLILAVALGIYFLV